MPGLSGGFFSGIGGALSDFMSADAMKAKGKGARLEAEQYLLSARYSEENKLFSQQSTEVKKYQTERAILKTTGSAAADVASSGFAMSGSALDIERDSLVQGALHKSILVQQGKIEEAAYDQQAASYRLMAQASSEAATAADKAAQGATYAGYVKAAGAIFSLF